MRTHTLLLIAKRKPTVSAPSLPNRTRILKLQYKPRTEQNGEAVNNARIAAVHRSRLPVSDNDAIIALVGASARATNFILWSHTQT